MKTSMEKVSEEIALKVLKSVSAVAGPPFHAEQLEENFHANWDSNSSRFPMNGAMDAALGAAIAGKVNTTVERNREKEKWNAPISEEWDRVASETVEEYFNKAEMSFDAGEHLEGTETLTDSLRVSLGHIAARREWPHGTDDDLYRIAAALATGGNFPADDDSLYNWLNEASEEGMDLCGALGASMGRPDSIRCGLYGDRPDEVRRDALLFARTTIELAKRLAEEKAVAN